MSRKYRSSPIYCVGRDHKARYRSRSDLVASILQSAAEDRNGVGFTKIMYGSFLSYTQTSVYLKTLKDHFLLDYDDARKKFMITPKGLKYLDLYGKMEDMMITSE